MFFLRKLTRKFIIQIHCLQNFKQPIVKLHDHSLNESHFKSILIVNRGEIACRIIKTAKRMGIKTVAVYSTADAFSKHVRLADEAFFIGSSTSKHSYLDTERLLTVIKSIDVDAVHPGYGFLSENANFVELLEKENVTFIGPSSLSISLMGDKLKSKQLAKEAGVITIPGYDGIIQNAEHCVEISKSIGYPVVIKATSGGGGKGMRVVKNDSEAKEAFKLSTEEALSSFGSGHLLIEKFLINPRHIEIQILGDKHGNLIHLNERECSIQKRNQKIVEEAPSTLLNESMREKMTKQAIAFCKQFHYYSVGTVEFLVDENRNFYFLEMNTRLQVEHAVTECITGIDLVSEMIKIAEGKVLDIKQEDVTIKGWAIESRIYAENPYKSFGLPSTGQLYYYKEPAFDSVRCDSGVEEGSLIDIYYDPLISKLICHGRTREDAIQKSINALDYYVIFGVNHNIPLLRDILRQKQFIDGNINVNYLSQLYVDGFNGYKLNEEEQTNLLTMAVAIYMSQSSRNKKFSKNEGFEDDNLTNFEFVVSLQEDNFPVNACYSKTGIIVQVNGVSFKLRNDINLADTIIENYINDQHIIMQLHSKNATGEVRLVYQGTTYDLRVLPKTVANLLKLIQRKPKPADSKIIKSPMPGLLKKVFCNVGDDVVEGQELCIIEAMKMQNLIVAVTNGRIKHIHIQEGHTVGDEDPLLEFL